MLARLHILRHGEVDNPDGVVYADLPGFGLSELGMHQATAAADHLRYEPIDAVWSSPLQRAVETGKHLIDGAELHTDQRLTEWALGVRWAGAAWDDLPTQFPGEVEAYLAHPADLPFTPETIAEVAGRMREAVAALGEQHPNGRGVVVTHQDPAQALRLSLTGRSLDQLQHDKPGHACIVTLTADGPGWAEESMWCPQQAAAPFPPVDDSTAP